MSSSRVNGRGRAGWWRSGAVALTMMALSGASARTVAAAEENLRCQIPFSFTVDWATLPPGTYSVVLDNAAGLVELRDQTHGAFALGIAFDAARVLDAKLVFHRYGDQYVLREVWPGTGTGRELPEPRRERELSSASRQDTHAARFARVELPLL